MYTHLRWISNLYILMTIVMDAALPGLSSANVFLSFYWCVVAGSTQNTARQYFPYVSSESDLQRYKAITFRQNSTINEPRASSSLSNVPSDSNKVKVSAYWAINDVKWFWDFVFQWILVDWSCVENLETICTVHAKVVGEDRTICGLWFSFRWRCSWPVPCKITWRLTRRFEIKQILVHNALTFRPQSTALFSSRLA